MAFSFRYYPFILILLCSFSLAAQDISNDTVITIGSGIPRSEASRWSDMINVKDFGASPNNIDNSSAFQSAITLAAKNGGTVYIPSGIYAIGETPLLLPSGVKLQGAGMYSTVIRATKNFPTSQGIIYAESANATTYRTGIGVFDLTLDGQVQKLGFSEYQHLMSLNGVKDTVIERVRFLGFRGDGLFLGSGYTGSEEKHNINVSVRLSVFNGVNNQNRNGISIIDGDGIFIERNSFNNIANPKMPGAIDIEPDQSFNAIQNILIQNNKFRGTGNGSINVILQNLNYKVHPSGFVIANNDIVSVGGKDMGVVFVHRGDATFNRKHAITFSNNRLVGTNRGLQVLGINGINITGNTFDTTFSTPIIGWHQDAKNIGVKVRDNQFINLSTLEGSGLAIFSVEDLLISGNSFIDCVGYAIDFNTGISNAVRIENNYFSSPNKKTLWTIKKEALHTFTPRNNVFISNVLLTDGNSFEYNIQ
jgi:hypothetical protein